MDAGGAERKALTGQVARMTSLRDVQCVGGGEEIEINGEMEKVTVSRDGRWLCVFIFGTRKPALFPHCFRCTGRGQGMVTGALGISRMSKVCGS